VFGHGAPGGIFLSESIQILTADRNVNNIPHKYQTPLSVKGTKIAQSIVMVMKITVQSLRMKPRHRAMHFRHAYAAGEKRVPSASHNHNGTWESTEPIQDKGDEITSPIADENWITYGRALSPITSATLQSTKIIDKTRAATIT
jgi:hypothetical protein